MLSRHSIEILRGIVAKQPEAGIDVDALCFPGQAALVKDPSRNVVVVAGRRWGKSVAAILKAVIIATSLPGVNCLFIAATRPSAKKLAWKALRDFNAPRTTRNPIGLSLGGVANWTELSMTFLNGSQVFLMGVDTEKAADLVRGVPKLAFAAVDEVQRGRYDVLTTLIRDVIRPALRDVRGTLWLLGTPNPAGKVGVLWERWNEGLFSRHSGTIYDNTKLGTREQTEAIIAEDLQAEGETKEGAFFQREYLARWVVDLASRVYQFEDERNLYEVAPPIHHRLVVVDTGWRDADAVGDIGWNDFDPAGYLIREDIAHNQTLAALQAKLAACMDEEPEPHGIIVDAGGGGKKTFESLRDMMPDAPLIQADKPSIMVQVKGLNDLLRTGRFKVRADSRFAKDVRQVGWVKGIVGGKVDEESYHSDIIPACRYGAKTLHLLLPKIGRAKTQDELQADAFEADRRERMERAMRRSRGYQEEDLPEMEDPAA